MGMRVNTVSARAIRQQLLSRFGGGQVMVLNLQVRLMTELVNHNVAID